MLFRGVDSQRDHPVMDNKIKPLTGSLKHSGFSEQKVEIAVGLQEQVSGLRSWEDTCRKWRSLVESPQFVTKPSLPSADYSSHISHVIKVFI